MRLPKFLPPVSFLHFLTNDDLMTFVELYREHIPISDCIVFINVNIYSNLKTNGDGQSIHTIYVLLCFFDNRAYESTGASERVYRLMVCYGLCLSSEWIKTAERCFQ